METFDFLTSEVTQGDLVAFADERVNLKQEYAQTYREQIRNLREHLERYIEEHPEMGLAKMLLSGSLAKGTALSTINDADVALYVKGDGVPRDLTQLLEWLVERLRTTFHQISKDKIFIDGPCIVICYTATGIKVEVAPILFDGDKDWRGYLWDRSSGKQVLTSIPLHLDFIRQRKEKQPAHFAQVVRFLKWWVRQRQKDTNGFVFRSFLVELVMAKLCDKGVQFADYHTGLEEFFTYVQNTRLKERIAFTDNYQSSDLPSKSVAAVEIFDPVNPENNVAGDMSEAQRQLVVTTSEQALDLLSYARNCQTKGESVECWQELMGQSFNA